MTGISKKNSPDLKYKKENEQNSLIIAKQKVVIKNLKDSLAYLSSENEKLIKLNNKLEALLKQSVQEPNCHNTSHIVPHVTPDSPAPPPKSPYRIQSKALESEGCTKQTFQSGKRPPELKLVSSNKNTLKQNFIPQPNSPLSSCSSAGLDDGLYRSSRPHFSHRDPRIPSETVPKEDRRSQECRSNPSTPLLPRTPRYDSLTHSNNLNNMNNLYVDVISSTVHIDEKGKEMPLFTIGVHQNGGYTKNKLWNLEKSFHEIQTLDKSLKENNLTTAHLLKKLPEKSLVVSHAPAKVDERKRAVEEYLQHVVSLNMPNVASLREFLSPEVAVGSSKQTSNRYSIKEGYLTKKRKNIGGWLLRYYILCSGGLFTYFESKDGNLLGTINLNHSQILNYTVSEQNYRHAFVVLEHKASNQVQKHILCADSDEERDQWVAHLRRSVQHENQLHSEDSETSVENNKTLKKMASMELAPSQVRTSGQSYNSFSSNDTPSPRTSVSDQTGLFLVDRTASGSWSSKKTSRGRALWKAKKTDSHDESFDQESDYSIYDHQVFGIPLDEVVAKSKAYDQCVLPAIVFRCIEYLESKGALLEEGLYRMSGSALEIKDLKRRFNNEGDVDLLKEDEYHDIHAVAGLLKMWLRELPENVLTKDLLRDYIDNSQITDYATKIDQIGNLVSFLPLANYTLLRFLCGHLVRVIQNANKNKMTLGNICVVFSATLEIPSNILQMMLMKFNKIFWTESSLSNTEQDDEDETFPTEDTLKIYMQDIESHEYLLDAYMQNKSRPSLQNKNLGQSTTSLRSARNSIYYRHNTPEHFVSLEKKLKEIDTDSFLYDEDSYYFSESEFEVAYFASRSSANSKNMGYSS